MADIRYTGAAKPVAQIDKFTPADPSTGDIFYLTVTGLDGSSFTVSYTVDATETVAAVTAGLVAAWNAATNILCTVITAADITTYMTLTADVPGDAFTVTATVYDGGGAGTPTLTRAAVIANAGPKDWTNIANWSGAAVPGGAASQNVYIDGATLLYNLDQSAIANALSSLHITNSQIGVNPYSDSYAPLYMLIKTSILNIDNYSGPGGTGNTKVPVNINTGATACEITVFNSGDNSKSPAVRILAASASTNIKVFKGRVGIAYHGSETTTVGIISVYYTSDINNDSKVTIGAGVTLTTYIQTGGANFLRCAATTVTSDNGTLNTEGSGAITTLNARGGTVTPNSSGTITNLNVQPQNGKFATVDLTKSPVARTITNTVLDPGGTIKEDPAVITHTNGITTSKLAKITAAAA